MLVDTNLHLLDVIEYSIMDYLIDIAHIVSNIPDHLMNTECDQNLIKLIKEKTCRVERKFIMAQILSMNEQLFYELLNLFALNFSDVFQPKNTFTSRCQIAKSVPCQLQRRNTDVYK